MALNAEYMDASGRSGEARLLWDDRGRPRASLTQPAHAPRARLGLPERLLRALEADGLVEVVHDGGDRRSRVARLTSVGRSAAACSIAARTSWHCSLLAPLSAPQQERLVVAMGEVRASADGRRGADRPGRSEHEDARSCLRYTEELNLRSQRRFDPEVGATAPPEEFDHRRPVLRRLPARRADGCGAAKHRPGARAQIKCMSIAPTARGLGSDDGSWTRSSPPRGRPVRRSPDRDGTATSPKRSRFTPPPVGPSRPVQ